MKIISIDISVRTIIQQDSQVIMDGYYFQLIENIKV